MVGKMAACKECGQKAGMLREICSACEVRLQEQREAENRARREAESAAWEAEIDQKLQMWVQKTTDMLQAGESVFLYQTVFVSVDSTIEGDALADFNMMGLQARGLAGWKVLGIIPKTYGSPLTNTQTTQWGTTTLYAGGMGGNVLGVYVVLSKEVSSLESNQLGAQAIQVARELIEEGFAI